MKPECRKKADLTFYIQAAEHQRNRTCSVMADAVAETRTAANQAARLTDLGRQGLHRLEELWCLLCHEPEDLALEMTETETLASVVVQLYAVLLRYPYLDVVMLGLYLELDNMMHSLMQGDWFA